LKGLGAIVMKLKYYMRGLGIGIILTTLVLAISGNKEKLTNEEIISRAMKLGMVMEEDQKDSLEEVLENSNPNLTATPWPTVLPELSITPEPTKTPDPTETPEPTETPKPTETPEPIEETQNQENMQKDITFTIITGMSSGKVSDLLYKEGLVDNPKEFNAYIVQAGKADVIRVGTFTAPLGTSYEEILNLITSK